MAIDDPTETERVALCEWLTANGIDPSTVPLYDSSLRIAEQDGQRLICYTEYVLTDTGRKQTDPDDIRKVWMRPANVPCTTEPPAWLNVSGGPA